MRANEVVCLLADRDLTGDGVEVEFFGECTTLPGGPGDARAAQRRAAAPGRVLLPRRTAATRRTSSRRCRRARAGRLRDDLARVTQDLAHRFEDLIREAPTHWHLLQPNWPSDRGSDPAAARSGVG